MPHPPNRLIKEAFLNPTVEAVRRVEIYENDAETPWHPEIWDEILVGGTVNVQSDQDSRRSADFEFYNIDGLLNPEPGEFWYDKIIKAYYGIVTHMEDRSGRVVIIEEESATSQALYLKKLLNDAGILYVDYNPLISTIQELEDYDIVISISGDYTRKLSLLTLAYQSGKSVLTFGLNSTSAQLPLLIGNTGAQRIESGRYYENIGSTDPISTGWDAWNTRPPGVSGWGTDDFESLPLGATTNGEIVMFGGEKVYKQYGNGTYRASPAIATIQVSPGDIYYFEAYVYKVTAGAIGGLHFVARQFESVSPNVGPSYPNAIYVLMTNIPQGQWHKVTGSVTIADGKTILQPYLQTGNGVPAGEEIMWKGVHFRKFEENQRTRPITATPAHAVALEQKSTFGYGALMRSDPDSGVWVHTQMADFRSEVFVTQQDQDNFTDYLLAITKRADTYDIDPTWETQVGEFVMEAIADVGDVINDSVNITARDYAKRCQASKLSKATMFKANQRIVDIIKSVALNAGVRKLKLPETLALTLGKDTTWERDQERWAIMKDIAVANNYDLWFDNEGYLRLTPQNDPLLTPATLELTTGPRGNLVSRGRRTSDAGLFNHVTAVGESSASEVPLVYGEAVNDNPASPSSVQNIGYRTKNITSPLITTDEQARVLAETFLSVSMLEEFELDFSSVLFPWIEAGEILEMNEDEAGWAPARYLLTSLSIPFDLSPMSGTGKRVTKL
ncbi:minor tail protein [Gordonia phage Jumbo]|uniref:Minor tail protein n=1 Tax=Gordonia phage Jumbo TaxID=1887650 RepID=A0A1B3B0K9_9CAUD|nr:tail protein [Gordonia phage Jumbo]AOE44534.1 minor tail protein [Gordonia phage Jumbo]